MNGYAAAWRSVMLQVVSQLEGTSCIDAPQQSVFQSHVGERCVSLLTLLEEIIAGALRPNTDPTLGDTTWSQTLLQPYCTILEC